jgi:hypothetical protein
MVNRKSGDTVDGLTNTSFSCPECGNGFGLAANPMEARAIRELVLHTETGGIPEEAGTEVKWDKEALERLSKIPDFVRDMAKKGIEKYAADKGFKTITADVIAQVKEIYGM